MKTTQVKISPVLGVGFLMNHNKSKMSLFGEAVDVKYRLVFVFQLLGVLNLKTSSINLFQLKLEIFCGKLSLIFSCPKY